MDKYEYRIRAEEINSLIEQQEYLQAAKIADTIDWRRVRSGTMLCRISELYKMIRRYEDSKEVLLLAYDQHPQGPIYRKIIYSLCELSIKLEEIVQAVEYYKEFAQVAPRDTGRFILQYRLYEAQDVSLEERIAVLEEYKKRDYREKWAYELAYLYHRIGLATRCIEECDEMILWFGEGKYVLKAMELKMLHAPLSLQQQEKYNARFLSEMEAIAAVEEESRLREAEIAPSMPIEIKSMDVTKAKTARIPSKQIQEETEVASETKEIPSANIQLQAEEDEQLAELEAIVEEIKKEKEENGVELEEAVDDAEDTEEETSEESEEDVEEDSDMKIVDSVDDLDIQIKTIDVGDQYSTINLQEALAADLAKLFAEEDMGQIDATRALPIDTVEMASKIMSQQQQIEENKAENSDEESEEDTDIADVETVENEESDESEEILEEADELEEEDEEAELASEIDVEIPQLEEEGDVDDLTMLLPPMDLSLAKKSDEVAEDEVDEEEEISEVDDIDTTKEMPEVDGEDDINATKEMPIEEIREMLKDKESEEALEEEPEEDILSKETKVIPVDEINEVLQQAEEEEATEEAIEDDVNETEEMPEEDSEDDINATKEMPIEEIREMLKDKESEEALEEEPEEDILSKETKIIPVDEINEALQQAEEVEATEEAIEDDVNETEEMPEEDSEDDINATKEMPIEEIREMLKDKESEEALEEEPEEDILSKETKVIPVDEINEALQQAEEVEDVVDEEPASEIVEIVADEKSEERNEDDVEVVQEKQEEVPIAPPIYGNNVAMPDELLEQWKKIAMEAAKQAAVEAAQEAAKQAAAEAAEVAKQAAEAAQAAQEAVKQTATVMQSMQPEMEAVNTEETVDQPETEEEDKQVTGQLSFADIMDEWEKTKKENEEKHIEEMKQRVLDQTGPLFGDSFMIDTKEDELDMISPMLDVFKPIEEEPVEKTALEQQPEEVISSLEAENDTTVDLQEQQPEEAIEEVAEEIEKPEEIIFEPVKEEVENEIEEIKVEEPVEQQVEKVEEDQPEDEQLEEEKEPISANFNTEEINGLEEKLMSSLSEQHYETANIQLDALEEELTSESEKQEESQKETALEDASTETEEIVSEPVVVEEEKPESEDAETEKNIRNLTKEEKDMFGAIAQTRELQQNLAMALDAISMAPYTGNVIVTAEEGVGALDIAKQIPAYLTQTKDKKMGKLSVLTFNDLKSKDIIQLMDEHEGGTIIIERAGELSQQAIVTLTNALKNMTNKTMLMILVDTKPGIERLKAVFARLSEIFTVEMNINSLDTNGLVKYAHDYARHQECVIDTMAELALCHRIEEKQTVDHAVTIDEVKEIINAAIEKAETKNVSYYLDLIMKKKTDKDAYTILREKDFLEENK